MGRPITVQERDQAWANAQVTFEHPDGWEEWLPDELPEPPTLWPGAVWTRPTAGVAVDLGRTRELRAHPHNAAWMNARTGMGVGRYSGVPWQDVSDVANLTKVYMRRVVPFSKRDDGTRYGLFPYDPIPLPPVVRRIGDPAGGGDLQWIGYDDRYLWELSSCTPAGWPYPWAAGKMHRWDLTKPWNTQGVKGTTAGSIPLLPMVATPGMFARGRITVAAHFVVPAAKKGAWKFPAGGSDATWADHPLVYGDWMRLTRVALDRVLSDPASTSDDRTFATGLHEFGAYIDDQTGLDGLDGRLLQGNIRTAQDPRIQLRTRLTMGDFEILAT